MMTQHVENLSWISSLGNKLCSLGELGALIEKYIPNIAGHPLDPVVIDINQWNTRQNAKYGRSIDFGRDMKELANGETHVLSLGDGVYGGSNGLRALVVQRPHCIGVALKKSRKTYNEVIQMGDLIISRGDIASSSDRKMFGFDGN